MSTTRLKVGNLKYKFLRKELLLKSQSGGKILFQDVQFVENILEVIRV